MLNNEVVKYKQKLIMDAMDISNRLNQLENDKKSCKTLKVALFKIYQKELYNIKIELEKIEERLKNVEG